MFPRRLRLTLTHFGRIVASYSIAAATVAAATVATRLLWDIGDHAIFTLFIGAVAISAWFGGLGPGLAATVLSELATAFVLVQPGLSLAAVRDHILRLLAFTFIAVLTSSLHAENRRTLDQREKARRAAESASTAKDKFLAMVSHELRNPLNPVMMVASALERDPTLSKEVKQDLAMIRRNVALELRLIDDLLDLSRSACGKLKLRMQPVDLYEALSAAVRVCEQDLRSKQIDLKIERSSAQLRVIGDPLRLEQVFWNLLRNAVKFTPDGGRIDVRLSQSLEKVVVEVCDTGMGIDPERLASIFRAFEQGGEDIAARFGGLGLGLAICQSMCEAHGGSVTAASRGKGCGATFTVTLPALPGLVSHGSASDRHEATSAA